MQHECQLEQPRLMSGCSWCEAAQAQRQRETAGYKAPPPLLLLPRVRPRSWKCLRPPLSSLKKHNTEGHWSKKSCSTAAFLKRQPVAGYACSGRKHMPAERREGKGGEGL